MFDVKVSKSGQKTRTVQVENGTTVKQAIADAGFEQSSGEVIQVNAQDATLETRLTESCVVTLAKGAKGAKA